MNGQGYLQSAGRLEGRERLDPWTALMRVLVAELQSIDLPAQLRPALTAAARHWAGHSQDLAGANEQVWRFINGFGPGGADLGFPEGRSARALLCVLVPAGDDEARSMTAEWFASMVDDQQGAR